MSPEPSHILTQLADGELSVDEAAQLLRSRGGTPAAVPGSLAGRWLRVRVTDLFSGNSKVSVNLPLAWVALGLKIAAHRKPEIAHLDLNELFAAIQAGASGRLVDVEDAERGERVEVSVE